MKVVSVRLPHFNSRDLLWLKNQLFPFRIEHHNTGRIHAVVDEDVRFAVNIDAHSAKGLKGNRLERLPVKRGVFGGQGERQTRILRSIKKNPGKHSSSRGSLTSYSSGGLLVKVARV